MDTVRKKKGNVNGEPVGADCIHVITYTVSRPDPDGGQVIMPLIALIRWLGLRFRVDTKHNPIGKTTNTMSLQRCPGNTVQHVQKCADGNTAN